MDLLRACVARDPGARPSASGVQAALETLLPLKRPLQQQEAAKPDSAAATASVPAGVGPDTPPQTQQGRREAALEHASAAPCQERQDDRAQTAGLLQAGASTVPGLDASAPP